MIEITQEPISLQAVIDKVKTAGSGCVATYVGLIRDNSQGKPVLSVEYQDTGGAERILSKIAADAGKKWRAENIAITHRVGKLAVNDTNLVVAVAAAHRSDGFAACQYIIDQFKQRLPTRKTETYRDGTATLTEPAD